jgi:hypothetical protein
MKKEQFSIKAQTYTLLAQGEETKGILENRKYSIPIYQRPYSWDIPQLDRFIKSIVKAYKEDQEPYFLGTVQLMPPKEGEDRYKIIDGQQRFTSMLLLFKAFLSYLPESSQHLSLFKQTDWLETKVNKGEQQQYLEAVMNDHEGQSEALNIYFRNYRHIQDLLDSLSSKGDDGKQDFEVNDAFVNYCLSKLYFVVIETQASLSKTLDIFNTINTAGMDLNGGDLFKIQMFDYLVKYKNGDDKVFNDIDDLYAYIDQVNKDAGKVIATIQSTLYTYKFILISKNATANTLHALGQDRFYEQLFQVLLNDEKIQGFDQSKFKDALDLSHLRKLVKIRTVWEQMIWGADSRSYAHQTYMRLIWWSRYGSFWIVDLLYLYRFYTEEGFDEEKFHEFTKLFTKYVLIFSIRYRKIINRAKTFCYALIRDILNEKLNEKKSEDDVINKLKGELKNHYYYSPWDFNHLLYNLRTNDIFEVTKKKNLLTRISAILEEEQGIGEPHLHHKYFGKTPIDIEHIQARNPEKGLPEEWHADINTLGNLIVLDAHDNKSLQNKKFPEKRERYKGSEFPIVQQFAAEHEEWTVAKCQARTKQEVKKILTFIFEDVVDGEIEVEERK